MNDELITAPDYRKDCLPNLSIDCVIFGYHEKQIKILCTHFAGMSGWLLPGGYIGNNENIDDAASRILKERTGVEDLFLKQFKTFGDLNRAWNHPDNLKHLPKTLGGMEYDIEWISTRFVSVGYYALTEFSRITPETTGMENDCRWFDIQKLPPMLIDHERIIEEALKTLRLQIHHEPIGLNLLAEKFTLPEMQALYETIIGKKLDQRNFTKKLVALDIVKKLDEKKHIGGHRAPSLYKFNKRNYHKALKEGVALAF